MDFLGYKKVKIVLFGPETGSEQNIKDLADGAAIFSEYPNITTWLIKDYRKNNPVVAANATAEACVPHDFPYGVCVSETGASLRANGLRVIQELFCSETVLLVNPDAHRASRAKAAMLHELCQRIVPPKSAY
ncbi:MAG: hypothetical protein Q8R08_03900 [bacterium]|nr:hypothetical protein [bacterium]